MSDTSSQHLMARVEALEKAVQALLGAVKMLETLHENAAPQTKAGGRARKIPVKRKVVAKTKARRT